MTQPPTLADIALTFFRLGATAYGGPAMMPEMRRALVERLGWLSPEGFKMGLALCQTIPGGTLMQVAAYTGYILRGLPGALVGYGAFALPATLLITGLAALYHRFQGLQFTQAIMAGLSVVVLAIILLAVVDFWQKYARGGRQVALTLAAATLFLGGVGPAWIVVGAALAGLYLFRDMQPPPVETPCLGISWPAVVALVGLALGWLAWSAVYNPILHGLSVSMAKVDLLAFGGYGAFPVMYHEVVELNGWMDAQTFLDGMALAQVTPGPTLLASAFVGYHLQGLVGAACGALWVFTPSFFMLMLAVPQCGRLLGSARFRRALTGVLSTLGGLILAVGITLVRTTDWSWLKVLLGLVAALALWRKVNPLWVVLGGCLTGWLWL